MSVNIKFYLITSFIFLVLSFGGYLVGARITGNYLENNYQLRGQTLGLDALGVGFVIIFGGLLGFIVGMICSIIIIHKLSKRWGSQLDFGGHPVLKLTALSFLTFLGLLFLLLLLYPSK